MTLHVHGGVELQFQTERERGREGEGEKRETFKNIGLPLESLLESVDHSTASVQSLRVRYSLFSAPSDFLSIHSSTHWPLLYSISISAKPLGPTAGVSFPSLSPHPLLVNPPPQQSLSAASPTSPLALGGFSVGVISDDGGGLDTHFRDVGGGLGWTSAGLTAPQPEPLLRWGRI